MPLKEIQNPSDLVSHLVRLFPAFAEEWDDGEAFGYHGDYTYHSVMMVFCYMSQKLLRMAEVAQVQEFCELVNTAVAQGGKLENAVSTCFLEHASQVGVRKIVKPYISPEAKLELR